MSVVSITSPNFINFRVPKAFLLSFSLNFQRYSDSYSFFPCIQGQKTALPKMNASRPSCAIVMENFCVAALGWGRIGMLEVFFLLMQLYSRFSFVEFCLLFKSFYGFFVVGFTDAYLIRTVIHNFIYTARFLSHVEN